MTATAIFLLAATLAAAEPPLESPPVNVTAPALTGAPTVGQALSCSQGSWAPAPSAFGYAWLRDGAAIPGQGANTYNVQSGDRGHTISCRVTASTSGGQYTISGLSSGTYKVTFTPIEGIEESKAVGNYLPQFYSGKPTLAESDPVAVTVGSVTPAVNAALSPGGQISGRVTTAAPGGAPIPGVRVCESHGLCANEVTDANGEYTISGLSTGSYEISLSTFGAGNFLAQTRTGVAVTAGATTSAVDFALAVGGQISGKVSAGAAPVSDEVCAKSASARECVDTNAGGEYLISRLPSGTYSVEFSRPETGNFISQSQVGVAVTAGATTSSVNAKLTGGGKVAGTVTAATLPLAGVEVCAEGPSEGCVSSNSLGGYVIEGLATGSYRVGFFAFFTGANYLEQYFNEQGSFETAEHVSVTVGATTPNVNAKLKPAGQLTGTITAAAGGAPLAETAVCIGEEFGNRGGCTTTNAAGQYTFSGLRSGDFEVRVLPEAEGLNYQVLQVNAVSVTAGATTARNFALLSGGQISGTVTAAAGGAPIAKVGVCAQSASSFACGVTNGGGGSTSASSNALAVAPAPNSSFSLVKSSFNAKTGDLDLFLRFANAGSLRFRLAFRNADVAFADAVGIGAPVLGEAASRAKRCKAGFIRHSGRCVHATVPFGNGSRSVPLGTVEISVHASAKALKALKAGRTLHVSGLFRSQSALGGAAVTHTESVVVRLPRKRHRARHH